MGKTFTKNAGGKRFGWKAERQQARRIKEVQRGKYLGKRVERAKGGKEED